MATSTSSRRTARSIWALLAAGLFCCSLLLMTFSNVAVMNNVSTTSSLVSATALNLLETATAASSSLLSSYPVAFSPEGGKQGQLQVMASRIRDLESRVEEAKEQAAKKQSSMDQMESLLKQQLKLAEQKVHELTAATTANANHIRHPNNTGFAAASGHNSEYLLSALKALPIEEEEALWDQLHGKEYQYRLTCPGHHDDAVHKLLNETNSTVLVGWHVGMIKNWKEIVKDQLNTLHQCGVGGMAERLFISYSNNQTMDKEVHELQNLLQRYPRLWQKTQLLYNNGQPVEGAAINALHKECVKRYPNSAFPPPKHENNNNTGETVVFYFHTKGSSRYNDDWRQHMDARMQYPTALYWRKYMEYFLLERPSLCVDQILSQDKFACGVWWLRQRKFYGGNFWVASGRYLSRLKALPVYPAEATQHRWLAEGWITEDLRAHCAQEHNRTKTDREWKYFFGKTTNRFACPSNPRAGLYNYLIRPREFSDYNLQWKSWWEDGKRE